MKQTCSLKCFKFDSPLFPHTILLHLGKGDPCTHRCWGPSWYCQYAKQAHTHRARSHRLHRLHVWGVIILGYGCACQVASVERERERDCDTRHVFVCRGWKCGHIHSFFFCHCIYLKGCKQHHLFFSAVDFLQQNGPSSLLKELR